jgi:uncharacterized membrane protein/Zn ribbon nucleic-acid-binding protein
MSRKLPRARRKGAATPAPSPGADVPLLVLSMVGILLAGYLTYTGWAGAQAAFCEEGSDCDLVQSSRWGTFLGVPTAFWGLLTYAALAFVAVRVARPVVRWWRAAFLASMGWAISAYLTAVSILVLDATCPYCLASLGVFTAIVGLLVWTRSATGSSWRSPLVPAALVAGLVMLAMHGNTRAPIVPVEGEDPYLAGLAAALSDSGARFYGASWCPHCNEQKAMFGLSAERLPYVECSPGGRQAPASRTCVAAGVRSYPTWVFGDGERVVSVFSPSELADRIGYKGPPEPSSAGS